MKQLAIIAATLLCVAVVRAGPYVGMTDRSPSVSATNTVVFTNSAPVSGKVAAYSVLAVGGSATVTVTTVAGVGSSVGGAKTLFPAAVVTVAGTATNFAAAQYLCDDLLVYRVDNAAITSAVYSVSQLILDR